MKNSWKLPGLQSNDGHEIHDCPCTIALSFAWNHNFFKTLIFVSQCVWIVATHIPRRSFLSSVDINKNILLFCVWVIQRHPRLLTFVLYWKPPNSLIFMLNKVIFRILEFRSFFYVFCHKGQLWQATARHDWSLNWEITSHFARKLDRKNKRKFSSFRKISPFFAWKVIIIWFSWIILFFLK